MHAALLLHCYDEFSRPAHASMHSRCDCPVEQKSDEEEPAALKDVASVALCGSLCLFVSRCVSVAAQSTSSCSPRPGLLQALTLRGPAVLQRGSVPRRTLRKVSTQIGNL